MRRAQQGSQLESIKRSYLGRDGTECKAHLRLREQNSGRAARVSLAILEDQRELLPGLRAVTAQMPGSGPSSGTWFPRLYTGHSNKAPSPTLHGD